MGIPVLIWQTLIYLSRTRSNVPSVTWISLFLTLVSHWTLYNCLVFPPRLWTSWVQGRNLPLHPAWCSVNRHSANDCYTKGLVPIFCPVLQSFHVYEVWPGPPVTHYLISIPEFIYANETLLPSPYEIGYFFQWCCHCWKSLRNFGIYSTRFSISCGSILNFFPVFFYTSMHTPSWCWMKR